MCLGVINKAKILFMNRLIVLILLVLASVSVQAGDVEGEIRYNASTGDTSLDLSLNRLNIRADGKLNDFISALGLKYQVPTSKIEHLLVDYQFTPADAYMTVQLSHLSGHSFHEVAHSYKHNKHKGWGFVAREMGIKPGSAAFHQLKREASMAYTEAVDGKAKGQGKSKNKGKGDGMDKKNKHKNKGNGFGRKEG